MVFRFIIILYATFYVIPRYKGRNRRKDCVVSCVQGNFITHTGSRGDIFKVMKSFLGHLKNSKTIKCNPLHHWKVRIFEIPIFSSSLFRKKTHYCFHIINNDLRLRSFTTRTCWLGNFLLRVNVLKFPLSRHSFLIHKFLMFILITFDFLKLLWIT